MKDREKHAGLKTVGQRTRSGVKHESWKAALDLNAQGNTDKCVFVRLELTNSPNAQPMLISARSG